MSVSFLAGTTGQIFMGIMLKPMSDELGWSRSVTAGAITAGTVLGGLMAPVTGMLADKFGARIITPLGAGIVGLALVWQGGTTELWQFYIAYAIARSVASNFLNGVAPLTTAANWFRTKRGRAMGFISMAFPLGGSAMTFVGQLIIEHSGWRAAFVASGSTLLLLGVVPAIVLLRRHPEDVGLLPDGVKAATGSDAAGGKATAGKAPTLEESFTLQEASKTSTFWLLVACQAITNIPNASLSYQMVAYYIDQGMPAAIAAGALSAYAFFGAVSAVLWGFLSERISEKVLACSIMVMAITGTLAMWLVHLPWLVVPMGGFLGLAARGEGALLNMIVAHYFGRGHYGKISGAMQPFNFVGLGSGPLIASVIFDLTHGYDMVFVQAVVSYAIGIVLILAVRDPKRPARMLAAAAGQ